VQEGNPRKTAILSSNYLISLDFFVLNLSSICHDAGLVRLGAEAQAASTQSYPQLL
jgi:hypothetical protein